jgi:hypothetical protein
MSDAICNKGVLYAKIKIGTAYLSLFNTHLQASYFGSSDFHWNVSIQTRTDQTDEMIYFLREIIYERYIQKGKEIESNNKFLLVGDFNIDAHNSETMRKVNYLTLN